MSSIRYKSGYKHQLVEDYSIQTNIRPKDRIEHDFMTLETDGKLCIRKDYAWDGASGPVRDTPTVMRGSLVHDALYQLMRQECLPREYREQADRLLRDICKEDGLSAEWAERMYWGVRAGGLWAVHKERQVKEAP